MICLLECTYADMYVVHRTFARLRGHWYLKAGSEGVVGTYRSLTTAVPAGITANIPPQQEAAAAWVKVNGRRGPSTAPQPPRTHSNSKLTPTLYSYMIPRDCQLLAAAARGARSHILMLLEKWRRHTLGCAGFPRRCGQKQSGKCPPRG